MISYETAQKIFLKCYCAPFTTLRRLRKNKGIVAKPIRWEADEIEALRFAMEVAFCKLQKEPVPEHFRDANVYAKFKIVAAVCDEARKLLKERSEKPAMISYEQDLDKNIADPHALDAFEEVDSRLTLEQICKDIQKPSQNLLGALVAFSKNEQIDFEQFGMSRATFFRLKKMAYSEMQKSYRKPSKKLKNN